VSSAAEHLEQALVIHQRLEAPFFTARSALELGRVLRRRDRTGDHERATRLLSSAADLAERYDCRKVLAEVRELDEVR
jgi:hypothetical protein